MRSICKLTSKFVVVSCILCNSTYKYNIFLSSNVAFHFSFSEVVQNYYTFKMYHLNWIPVYNKTLFMYFYNYNTA